ncbi:histidine kinase [Pseudolabrys sp. Root1462]|uniref:sensor histidine kinase n=1 Tax=Pseudolabrys sp. Root1462 TaxID=1736466 RepID=UPI000702A3E8|nr:histidine kinase dimerization/phosphoacceptor domain -containing protein [Pseudolabrys sp. Root1462]KQY97267.1 histidine kinase [Pseudolabrys sp. Root1462]
MTNSSDKETPVVESNTASHPSDLSRRALNVRLRQQEILAELGVQALQNPPFLVLLDLTARLVAEGIEAEYCKIMEYLPAENRLLVRAGVGWNEGVVGVATVGADLASPAGFALHTGRPVISNHLGNEQRFRTPELLIEHGIRRAMNVILKGDNSPFGVLEVDSKSPGEFGKHDLAFLQGAANILGMAIEQQQSQRKLQDALERHQLLIKEVNHRVKNSLQVVAGMLHLQAKATTNPEVIASLNEASSRISTVGRAYDHLAYTADYEAIDLIDYLRVVLDDLAGAVTPNKLHFEGAGTIEIGADRAMLIGLILNELVTNAGKYAYPEKTGGPIWVTVTRVDNDAVRVSIYDEGVGLPPGFDMTKSKRLGTRLVAALIQQLGAELGSRPATRGASFTFVVPLKPK